MNDYGKAVRGASRAAGRSFLRHGKGDDDVWVTKGGARVVVPAKLKSRHTASGLLKDAGLPKAF